MTCNSSRENEDQRAREGLFDAQLTFPTPFVEPPEPLTTIVKRDGHHAPFQTAKIADAIYRAATSVGEGDHDLAQNLASAVAIYLAKQVSREIPTVEQVSDAVELSLIHISEPTRPY